MPTYTYDKAQVCLNGHSINPASTKDPTPNRTYCPDCGEKTITNCQICDADIKGLALIAGMPIGKSEQYKVPNYCDNCGKPYPWIAIRQEVAKQIIQLSEELSKDEKNELSEAINDLVTDTPKTNIGILKFKKFVAKASKEVASGLKDVLVDVVSETVKKAIWG